MNEQDEEQDDEDENEENQNMDQNEVQFESKKTIENDQTPGTLPIDGPIPPKYP